MGFGLFVGGVGILWVDVIVVGCLVHVEVVYFVVNLFDFFWELVEDFWWWMMWLFVVEDDLVFVDVVSFYNFNVGIVIGGDWLLLVLGKVLVCLCFVYFSVWMLE